MYARYTFLFLELNRKEIQVAQVDRVYIYFLHGLIRFLNICHNIIICLRKIIASQVNRHESFRRLNTIFTYCVYDKITIKFEQQEEFILTSSDSDAACVSQLGNYNEV